MYCHRTVLLKWVIGSGVIVVSGAECETRRQHHRHSFRLTNFYLPVTLCILFLQTLCSANHVAYHCLTLAIHWHIHRLVHCGLSFENCTWWRVELMPDLKRLHWPENQITGMNLPITDLPNHQSFSSMDPLQHLKQQKKFDILSSSLKNPTLLILLLL